MTDARTVVDRIERYWLETGVPRLSVTEMRAELEQHLALAAQDGRKVSEVVGDDPAAFAESWAAAYRVRRHSTATWSQVQTGEAEVTRKTRRDLILFGVGMGAVVAAVAVAGQGGNDVDNEVWRWLWTIFAVVMGIGEIFTAGFFLLPFAIGAGAGAAVSRDPHRTSAPAPRRANRRRGLDVPADRELGIRDRPAGRRSG